VLALPLLVSAVILIFTGVFVSASNIPFNPDWKFFLALWLLPGAFADAFFGLRAWRGLREDFREVAAQRFAPRPTLWQRLFGPGAAAAPRSGV